MSVSLPTLRDRRWPGTVGALVVPAVLLGLALVYPGAAVSQVDLNDGAVWLTNKSAREVGRWNPAVGELNGGVHAEIADFDVWQDAQSVLVRDGAALASIDPAAVRADQSATLPTDAKVSMAKGVVAVLSPSGSLWVRTLDQLAEIGGPAADAELGEGAVAVVSTTSGEVLAATADGELHRLVPGATVLDRVEGRLAGEASAGDDLDVTAVGDQLVTLSGGRLRTPSAEVDLSDRGSGLVLQQPGPDSEVVLVSAPDALLEVPLAGGEVLQHPTGGSGDPARPVRVAGCAHAAWASAQDNYMLLCGSAAAQVEPLDEVSEGHELVFRVNRDVVVLNDVENGSLWSPLDDPTRQEPNWEDLPDDQQLDGENPSEDPAEQTVQSECTDHSASPDAADDAYGVRPGRTTILSVIDNDVSSDCGILVIKAVDALDPAFGTVTPIYGGRALQLITRPGASGSAEITYTITDGRGANQPSTARIRLTIRSDDQNGAPGQVHEGLLQVEAGATATYDVLPDFLDPDGDLIFLESATVTGGGTVRSRQDGQLTFVSDGTELGTQTVTLTVSDGVLQATGMLAIDVRPAGTVVPRIDPVHAVTYVGEPVTVHPLDAVRSASREPLRLAAVDELTGTEIATDLTGGTFTFTSAKEATYYVTFLVATGSQQATGIARIDVVTRPETPLPPVAVLDVALLPPDGEVVIDPLANDTDPAGGVLVLTSVDVPAGSGLEVAVLGHQLVRISSTRALGGSVTVPYTISNGTASATGELRVKPTSVVSGQQSPVVLPVTATVRTGGVVTIPVLESAYDPDGDAMSVDPTLVVAPDPGQGLLFVSGDVLRYQAPATPMTVHATFVIEDAFHNRTAGDLVVTVHASDATGKSAPKPRDLTARVFAGERIRIPVPLTGIDADGDGVTLLGAATSPTKGNITARGADWLEYEAGAGESGTDTFSYAVEDWLGQRAVATVRVGIAPRPVSSAQVVARNDEVTVRPGRTVDVRVLANDVDMAGGDLELESIEPGDADAQLSGRRIVVKAPDQAGTVQVAYTATNGRGGRDSAVLTVRIDPAAPIQPPVAGDVVVPASETLNALSVQVDVLEVAENPSGPLSDLQVSVDRSASDVAQVTPSGTVVVTLGRNPRTLPYLLTNTDPDANGVFAYAFITVPALGDFPPVVRPNAKKLVIYSGDELTIDLGEQLQVAPGRTARINNPDSVSATRSTGSLVGNDASHLRFVAPAGYAGPASITFQVADGPADDPGTRTAVITLQITVYDRVEHPPMFEPSVLDVAPGESTRVDLAAFVIAPVTSDPTDAHDYAYQLTGDLPAALAPVLQDSVLTLNAGESLPRGTVGSIGLSIHYGGEAPLLVQVDYRVVASQRPLARVVNRSATGVAGRPSTVDVLEGAYDPFTTPLQVVAANADGVPGARVERVGSVLTVTPPTGFVGPLVVRFRVRDASQDPDREVDGTYTLVVRDVPTAPTAPRVTLVGDRTVTLAWDAPVANGEPITGYRVTASPGGLLTDCPATSCAITGLTNDTEYTFTVVARNAVGDSAASPSSAPVRPDSRPGAPGQPGLAWGDRQVTATWSAPANPGSPIREYQVELSPAPPSGPAVVTTASTSYSFGGLTNGASYTVRVRATNAAPEPGDWSEWSGSQVPAGPPGNPGRVHASNELVGPGALQITVTWDPSAPNGDPVSRYDVQVDGDVTSVDGSAGSYTFAAQAGVSYLIDVRAANKAGTSAWVSTTGQVWSAPSAVRDLEVTDAAGDPAAFGQGALNATWRFPADGGGANIAYYLVSLDGGADVQVGARSYTFTGLPGGEHTVTVVPVNDRGAAGPPTSSTQTTRTVPQSATITSPPDTATPLQVTFSWAPGGDGGGPVTGYRYQVTSGGTVLAEGTTAGVALTAGGEAGQELTLVVWTINAEGESIASDAVSAVVAGPADGNQGGAGG